MKNSIEELKLEIESLKERISILEEANKNSDKPSKIHKTNLFDKEDYYKEEHESSIRIKNLKEPSIDKFGRICGVNRDIKIDYEEGKIDYYEYKVMLHLAIANQDYVGIKFIMDVEKLELEQVLQMLNKLKELGYVEIIKSK